MENNCLRFRLASPVRYAIDLQQGTEAVRLQRIDFPIMAISWIEGGFPKGLDKCNVYGNCLVEFIRIRSTSIRNIN
jgi:hypothetical protein